MKHLTLLLIGLLFSSYSFAQLKADAILGKWYNEDKDAVIQIFKKGNEYLGKILWLKEPLDENGKPKTDPENDDEKLRSRPRLGMVFMKEFVYEGKNKWDDGSIYDPKSGNNYSGTITMVSTNRLDLRGYVGFSWLGRTSNWTRKTN